MQKIKEKNLVSEYEFHEILADILNNETVLKMKNFRQHFDTSCYEHCYSVAFYSYIWCKKLGLDYKSAARAAMLHDLFLYDWRKPRADGKRFHAFFHPRIALNNSLKLFDLNEKEKDIILKHMWPLTVILPKYRESYIVTIADKYSALVENKIAIKHNCRLQKMYRYTYAFLSLLIIRAI